MLNHLITVLMIMAATIGAMAVTAFIWSIVNIMCECDDAMQDMDPNWTGMGIPPYGHTGIPAHMMSMGISAGIGVMGTLDYMPPPADPHMFI